MELFNYVIHRLTEISGIENLTLKNVLIFVLGSMAVFIIELVVVGWQNSSLKRILRFDKTIRTDFYCWLLETFNLFNFVAFLITFGVFYFFLGLLQKNVHFNLASYISNPYVQFTIIFVVGDFKNYIRHIVFHRYLPLWRIHEFHHSATTLSIITRYRGHFFETAVSTIFDVILFVIIGAPAVMFIYVNVLKEIHNMLVHSSLRSKWGFIGKYILVSPAIHRVHHSVETKHYNKNYGSTFIIWDRIFNTYHPGVDIKELGLPENPYNKNGFIYDVWLGIKRSGKALLNLSK